MWSRSLWPNWGDFRDLLSNPTKQPPTEWGYFVAWSYLPCTNERINIYCLESRFSVITFSFLSILNLRIMNGSCIIFHPAGTIKNLGFWVPRCFGTNLEASTSPSPAQRTVGSSKFLVETLEGNFHLGGWKPNFHTVNRIYLFQAPSSKMWVYIDTHAQWCCWIFCRVIMFSTHEF